MKKHTKDIYNPDWWLQCIHEPDETQPVKVGNQWAFCASMVSTCEPHFDHMDSNYAVRDLLLLHGVLAEEDQHDCESCCCYFYFDTKAQARAFCERLAVLLKKQSEIMGY